ncbi:MAG: methylenetetrahydrofolate reductase [NAD(P)H] [Bacteroidales bacterium]|nr:methylenetetrahydrofolate reductase [NAD(P)H] [Clostridium sp.]MCM1202990.1 methylenetetrahydrofolate reductase [NAD(P)H] [Bacteroidales bacterium]
MINDVYKPGKTVFSFEVFPPKKNEEIYDIYKTLDRLKTLQPDFISVTYGAGGSNSKKTAAIASYIKNICEIEPIAHLTAVAMDEPFLIRFLQDLAQKGVSNVLALRGDRPKDMCDEDYNNRVFLHAEDIIRIIHQQSEICIAAACYPEIHPESESRESDLQYLKQKVDAGVNFLITQMFFDNSKFYEFLDLARKAGINVPISAGIMPITTAKQLGTSVTLSGTSVPKTLSNLVARYADTPDDLRKAGIDYAINQINDLIANGVDGIHLYTMNRAAVSMEIMNQLRKTDTGKK